MSETDLVLDTGKEYYTLRDVLRNVPGNVHVEDVLEAAGERVRFSVQDIKDIGIQLRHTSLKRLFEEDPNATVDLGALLGVLPPHTELGDVLAISGNAVKFPVKDALNVLKRIRSKTMERLMDEIRQDNARQDMLFRVILEDPQKKFS